MDYFLKANTRYPTFDHVKKFQEWVESDPARSQLDQDWADEYIQPLVDFMGDSHVIRMKIDYKSPLDYPVNVPTMGFCSGHWYARKPGDTKAFNPYDEYQVPGTNQFCQTYALMYHANKLPRKRYGSWTKYYSYTLSALKFIKATLQRFPDDERLIRCVDECIKYPNICVNIIQ
jgi:hypothetical protein